MHYPLPPTFTFVTDRFATWSQWRKDHGLLPHSGVDLNCPIGTPVFAAIAGRATMLEAESFGKQVSINGTYSNVLIRPGDVDFFEEENLAVNYYHLNDWHGVYPRVVKPGELIGFSGMSGRDVTGPHLHLTVYWLLRKRPNDPNNRWWMVDPAIFYPGIRPGDAAFLLQDTVGGQQVRRSLHSHPNLVQAPA
jgi:murein DD-endopeptidase MepM/ murein hydrolase activator NlpD